jgi:hypothetical protein
LNINWWYIKKEDFVAGPSDAPDGNQEQSKRITTTFLLILGFGVLNLAWFGWKLISGSLKPEPISGVVVGIIFLAIPIFAAIKLRGR